ncbi:MAG: FAD-dependent oxidoreductase [Mycobacteriales bacterium]|nr:FAD-dependent oxidoreductase [Mycobacteriales bacterium]
MRVAVVGAGLSGVACARQLHDDGHEVVVLDRGRVVGGRLASRRLPDRDSRPVDLGASYLTARDPGFQAQVDDWLSRGLLHPWTEHFAGQRGEGPLRYGSPRGLRSLVEDLAAPLDLRLSTEVREVRGTSVDGQEYDAAVLALPDPQAAALLEPGTPAHQAVTGRAWEPVVVLAAGFVARTWDLDGVFVHDDPVLSWVADDGTRRGDGAAVLTAHSTGGFASAYALARPGAAPPRDPVEAGPPMVAALRRQLDLPEPVWTHVHRWSFARPAEGRDEPFWLADRLGLCGDGWGTPRVETAWLSGRRLGERLSREG